MKALRFEKTGDLKALRLEEVPKPEPLAGEVLVRIEAGGLNNSDVSNVLGKHPYTTLPRIPGRDFAGVVIEGRSDLVGRAVWGTGKDFGFTRDGSHAEFLSAPADGVALRPASLSAAQAAACGVPYTTAWSALERCEVREGTRLLVIGACGGVGSAALALARARGARIAGAVRRPEQRKRLAARDVASMLLVDGCDVAAMARPLFNAAPEVILDTTGAWLPAAIPALAPYGRVAIIVAQGDGGVSLSARDLYRRGASIVGVNSLMLDPQECAKVLAAIGKGFDAGSIERPALPVERPLARGVETYEEARRGSAKLVLVP